MSSKILIFDIETSPAIAFVWKFWQENVSAKQVLEHPHIMSFAAKWLDDPRIFYEENRKSNDKALVEKMIYYLDQADIVVAHNGAKFDIPKIKGRAAIHGLAPPSPVRIIDTCLIARKQFGLPSNSLEYLTNVFDCDIKKGEHKQFPGFELWLECLRGNDKAWKEMKHYNINDVLSLEQLYLKMRPYIVNHPNLAVYEESEKILCPKCSSENIQWRGYAYTNVSKTHRFQCNNCGGWGKSRYTLLPKNKNLIANN